MSTKKCSKEAKFIDKTNGEKKYRRKKRYPYKLYVPGNINIQELAEQATEILRFEKDYMVYVLHIIVAIPSRLKDFDIELHKGYTPICKQILSRRVHNYKQYINYLKKQKVIEEGSSYKPKYYAKGLKYSQKYRTPVIGVFITKNTLIKSITESVNNRDIQAEAKLSFLKDWFNPKLTIDMEEVIAFLEYEREQKARELQYYRDVLQIKNPKVSIEEIVTMGYNMKYIVADKINGGRHHHPIVDSTSGRFHSPLTQLKSELRQYVRYNGERLYALDIVNSQPLLSLVVIDYNIFRKNDILGIISNYNDEFQNDYNAYKPYNQQNPSSTMLVNLLRKCIFQPDVDSFKTSVISGTFYEDFGKLLVMKNLIPPDITGETNEAEKTKKVRKFAKQAMFTAFFSKLSDIRWNKYIQAFKACYPGVYNVFSLIKTQPKKLNSNLDEPSRHNTLACVLQRFESNLILHDICCEINSINPLIPLFTIHDSIATTREHLDLVKSIMEKHIMAKLGVNPKLKIEEW
ncbi:MAG TPA: hypothetical protein VF622_07695 [Segetibacter sp.]|jgi:hypothetical protein